MPLFLSLSCCLLLFEGARPAATAPISLIYISLGREVTPLWGRPNSKQGAIYNHLPAVWRDGGGGAWGRPARPSHALKFSFRRASKLHPKRQPRLAQQQAQSKAQLRNTTRRRQFLRWMM